MRPLAAALALACLAGCGSTPKDLMEDRPRADYKSTKAAAEAARCVTRNADELKWGPFALSYPATMRADSTRKLFDVSYGWSGWLVFHAQITPTSSGALISYWETAQPTMFFHGDGTLFERVTRGC